MYYSTILITSLLSCADPHASSSLAAKRFFRSRSFFFSPSTCGREVGVKHAVWVWGGGVGRCEVERVESKQHLRGERDAAEEMLAQDAEAFSK